MVHSGFLSPLLGDVDRVLHTVAQKTGSTAHCDLGVSDGHLSAVARQVSQLLLLFHLTPGDAEVCTVNVHMQGVIKALSEKKRGSCSLQSTWLDRQKTKEAY